MFYFEQYINRKKIEKEYKYGIKSYNINKRLKDCRIKSKITSLGYQVTSGNITMTLTAVFV